MLFPPGWEGQGVWSFVLTAAGLGGMWVAARHPRIGWRINIFVAQPLWVVYAVTSKQYGFLLAAAAYTIVYARLLRHAPRRRHDVIVREAAGPAKPRAHLASGHPA